MLKLIKRARIVAVVCLIFGPIGLFIGLFMVIFSIMTGILFIDLIIIIFLSILVIISGILQMLLCDSLEKPEQ